MNENLLEICNHMVKLGTKLGADEIECFSATQKSIDAAIEGNELKMSTRDESSGIGIRIFRNHSLGFAATNRVSKERAEEALRAAIALSRNAPPDIHNGLPNPGKYVFVPGVYDEEIAEMNESEVIEKASRMLVAAKGIDERVSVDNGRFEISVGYKAISNSSGIEMDEQFTAMYYDIGAHAIENGKISSMDYRVDGVRSLGEDTSEELAIELAELVVESLSARKIESFIGPVIISPFAALDLLLLPILFSVDSNNVQKGISRFVNKKGEQVASTVLSIRDDGTLPEGLSSSAFDREGVPHRPINILDNGRLKNFLYDAYTANKEGIESTGHASGGTRTVPSIDSTNIRVRRGSRTLEDMISSIKRGLLIQRFSGNVDPVSGDFSGIAKAGKRIDNGAIQGVVRETMISGNVYDLLARLRELSHETIKIADLKLPYFLSDEISITGV